MPAEAGIQRGLIFLGSRMRGNDDRVVIQSFPGAGFALPKSRACSKTPHYFFAAN